MREIVATHEALAQYQQLGRVEPLIEMAKKSKLLTSSSEFMAEWPKYPRYLRAFDDVLLVMTVPWTVVSVKPFDTRKETEPRKRRRRATKRHPPPEARIRRTTVARARYPMDLTEPQWRLLYVLTTQESWLRTDLRLFVSGRRLGVLRDLGYARRVSTRTGETYRWAATWAGHDRVEADMVRYQETTRRLIDSLSPMRSAPSATKITD